MRERLYLEIQQAVRERFVQAVRQLFGIELAEPVLGYPPSSRLGELSIASCFELARALRQSPRQIAEQLAPRLVPLDGIERVSVAGAGYLNFHLDRALLAQAVFRHRASETGEGRSRAAEGISAGAESAEAAARAAKILVEHTSINPNKAAHIGHLRNAVLGDTFARLLRYRGRPVEVQNYIDNTGVQVADVVVGFIHLEKKSLAEVRRLIDDPSLRFDYYCWDLYARVFQWYDGHPESLAWRAAALKDIEEGRGEPAAVAEAVSTAIVRLHLATMRRLNIDYDLLVRESEILRLNFWSRAFELLKSRGALRYEDAGKNRGCWVMSLAGNGRSPGEETAADSGPGEEEAEEDIKIIVRSNGTVTYVGKDIAYHLWKFGLLGEDFGYEPFHTCPDGHVIWRTAVEDRRDGRAPAFGRASAAYVVIDTRQAYLQGVVAAALRALGYSAQADNLHHFAYQVVNLSLRAAADLGMEVTEEDRVRDYVEVSGRKGSGVKADDLIDLLMRRARDEVQARAMTEDRAEQEASAGQIAVAALRYFLLKYTRRSIITFDFQEALAFEGETGPYLQYSVVRARNIFRKFRDAHPEFSEARPLEVPLEQLRTFLSGESGGDFWELVLGSAQLEMIVEQAIAGEEPATVAKYAFRLAQAFNNFYHRHRILAEPDAARQRFLLFVVDIVSRTLARSLELLGIEVPERM